jgi:pSer/pThr/pTyr-binding forkhead associated (FHA) protein
MANSSLKTLNYKEYARQSATPAPAPPPPAAGTAVLPLVTFRQPPPAARLVCVYPPGEHLGRLIELRPVQAVLGRDTGSDILVPDPSVSRAHARIDPRPDGTYEITDLKSSNGTFVNRERIGSRVLRNGDRVDFANVAFLYLTGDGV